MFIHKIPEQSMDSRLKPIQHVLIQFGTARFGVQSTKFRRKNPREFNQHTLDMTVKRVTIQ